MKPQAIVLTASIDDEDAIRRWIDSVGAATEEVRRALDSLVETLKQAPHIAITLRQHQKDDAL